MIVVLCNDCCVATSCTVRTLLLGAFSAASPHPIPSGKGTTHAICPPHILPNYKIRCKDTKKNAHFQTFRKKNTEKFAHIQKKQYLCSVFFT